MSIVSKTISLFIVNENTTSGGKFLYDIQYTQNDAIVSDVNEYLYAVFFTTLFIMLVFCSLFIIACMYEPVYLGLKKINHISFPKINIFISMLSGFSLFLYGAT